MILLEVRLRSHSLEFRIDCLPRNSNDEGWCLAPHSLQDRRRHHQPRYEISFRNGKHHTLFPLYLRANLMQVQTWSVAVRIYLCRTNARTQEQVLFHGRSLRGIGAAPRVDVGKVRFLRPSFVHQHWCDAPEDFGQQCKSPCSFSQGPSPMLTKNWMIAGRWATWAVPALEAPLTGW